MQTIEQKVVTGDLIDVRPAQDQIDLIHAKLLVADGYSRLSSQRPTPEAVFKDLYGGDHGQDTAIITNIASIDEEAVGTMRLNRLAAPGQGNLAPTAGNLGLTNLLVAPQPWEQVLGSPLCAVAEIERFALAGQLLAVEREQLKLKVFSRLFRATIEAADPAGCNKVVAIMPNRVRALLDSIGVAYHQVSDVRLAQEDPRAWQVFQRYDLYWYPQRLVHQPKLYIFDDVR